MYASSPVPLSMPDPSFTATMPTNSLAVQPYNYPYADNYFPPNPIPDDYPPHSYDSGDLFSSPSVAYGGQPYPMGYSNTSSPSPIISALAQEYVTRAMDAQYESELLQPYQQYLEQPYLVNNYF